MKNIRTKSIIAISICTASLAIASVWHNFQQNANPQQPDNKSQLPSAYRESEDSCSGAYLHKQIYSGEISSSVDINRKIGEWEEWKKTHCDENNSLIVLPSSVPVPSPSPEPAPVGKRKSSCCSDLCFKINHSNEEKYKLILVRDDANCKENYVLPIKDFTPPEPNIINSQDTNFFLIVFPKDLPTPQDALFEKNHKRDCLDLLDKLGKPNNTQVNDILEKFNVYCLLPSSSTNKVWLINITKGEFIEISSLEAEWFKNDNYNTQLYNLGVVSIYDNNFKIDYSMSDLKRIVISGSFKNKRFIYGINNYGFWSCIDKTISQTDTNSHLNIVNYLLLSGHERNLKKFYKDWFDTGDESTILAFLPTNTSLNPKEVLGITTGNEMQPSNMEDVILNNSKSDLMVNYKNNYYIYYTNGNSKKITEDFNTNSDRWINWLRIADPSVKMWLEAESGNFFFIFRNNTKKLWSWKGQEEGIVPVINEVLDGDKEALLSGNRIENLIKEWNNKPESMSETEKKFIRRLLTSHFVILDWFQDKNDFENRIILYANPSDSRNNSLKLHRLEEMPRPPIDIRCVDTKCTEWRDLKIRYLDFKKQFEEDLIYSAESQQEAWFAADKLAISKSKEEKLTFYLKKSPKRFTQKDISWNKIEAMILGDLPSLYLANKSLTKELFLICTLTNNWKSDFRANPLGYFDRIPNN